MVAEPRMTQESVEELEALMDELEDIISDGEITTEELHKYVERKRKLHRHLMYVDESIGIMVTGLRRGHASPSFQRRVKTPDIRMVHSTHDHEHDAAHIKSALH